MVERKPGCSNIIVQNFSEFDAYATYKRQDERKKGRDSFVHTKMGIVPKDGTPTDDKKCKASAMFTQVHRSDNIAPDKYWLCPTVDSEKKKKKFLPKLGPYLCVVTRIAARVRRANHSVFVAPSPLRWGISPLRSLLY
ncbi:hypothetical protein PCYB_145590 [Plasmodium cynomolgi strain B]|uniref:Uncharacterized protein n=1 Tax=Plasmodium cynomolgi (strain B) TaxID=1120755 RepID=K6UEX9_PLACD|nr:hypothetical protein PCYB_145590 [Plasmodium cynomolgi strain B]GAB69131.1 hypothetical protein PCYB_145590 [Plasmodium cynomolgi strain B]